MCGIVGFAKFEGKELIQESDINILQQMSRQLRRRGPDAQKIYSDKLIAMSFNRLAIVDVIDGMQPFHNEDNSIILLANGEIFNHLELRRSLKSAYPFVSRSDCEVLLALYQERGLDFLQDVNGMFGISIWDKAKKRLILARDRLGIKPMYYCQLASQILFGSELKALLVHPDCPKKICWDEILRYGLLLTTRGEIPSFFTGIRNLPAGHLLIADLDTQQVQERNYWEAKPPTAEEYQADTRSTAQIIEEYQSLLQDAVRLNLMSDVPVGLFLSGGIDSTSIAALSAKYTRLKTFTILSQSTFTNEDARYGHEVAKLFNYPNHQILFHWHKNILNSSQWKELLWATEHPACNAEHFYKFKLHEFAKSLYPDLKVMLLGQGSDEFNGGYTTAWLPKNRRTWQDFIKLLESQKRSELYLYPEMLRMDYYFRNFTLNFDYLMERNHQQNLGNDFWYFNTLMSQKRLQIYNLWHEDRTAASHGIENRVPFLDHRLIEFCLKVPPHKRSELFWDKHILRQAMQPFLPERTRARTKVPLYIGADTRFTNRLLFNILMSDHQALLEEALSDSQHPHPVISPDTIRKAVTTLAENPEYPGIDCIFLLINACLLEKMAQQAAQQISWPTPTAVTSEIVIDNWEQQVEQMQLTLGCRRLELSVDSVLQFTANSFLVKLDSASVKKELNFLIVNGNLEYYFDEEDNPLWVNFLRRIDGKRSIKDILAELQIEESAIRKDLEEAIDFNIVKIAA